MLLVANYIFYGAWDWRFLSLILISTVIDYVCGLKIHGTKSLKTKKLLLFVSIFANLAMLGFFKYFNFFAENFQILLAQTGLDIHPRLLNIVLPVGISFYTFQTMSYTIDVYRDKLTPCRSLPDFALFVSFFPQLVAGPIERAKNLLPQILNKRTITWQKFLEGCHLILWGLFQKIFIADNLARIVEPVFSNHSEQHGATILIAAYAFAFQIFCDFAGYSNIARGLAKCMGFELMVNFNLPYFATNPQEFWQRWHISLSTWLRDYLYFPLGGNRNGNLKTCRNLFVVMLLGGLWHGAAWTFVLWGLYHGILLVLHRLLSPLLALIAPQKNSIADRIWFLTRVIFFFHLVTLGLLLFRCQSVGQFFDMTKTMCMDFNLTGPSGLLQYLRQLMFLLSVLIIVQIFQYRKKDLLITIKTPTVINAAFHALMFYLMVLNSEPNHTFIYFQF